MSELTDKTIREHFDTLSFDEKYFPVYSDRVKKLYDEYQHELPDSEDKPSDSEYMVCSLSMAAEYLESYYRQSRLGHGDVWSNAYAENAYNYSVDEESLIRITYDEINENNEELADREIDIHASSLSDDALFKERYKYLIHQLDSGMSEVAQRYCGIYRNSINEGKSELFARTYADIADDESFEDEYCVKFAEKYEELINDGFDEFIAASIAHKYAEYYFNNGEREDPAIPEYWEREIDGEIRGWKYVKSMNLERRFVKIYQKLYLEIHFCNKPELVPWSNIDEFILDAALSSYEGTPKDLSYLDDYRLDLQRINEIDSSDNEYRDSDQYYEENEDDEGVYFSEDEEEAILNMMFPEEDNREEQYGDYMDKL